LAAFSGFLNTCIIQTAENLHFFKFSEDFEEVTYTLVDNEVETFVMSDFYMACLIFKKNRSKELYSVGKSAIKLIHSFEENDVLDSSFRIALKTSKTQDQTNVNTR